jgi:hypothetical protein
LAVRDRTRRTEFGVAANMYGSNDERLSTVAHWLPCRLPETDWHKCISA